MRSRDLEQRVAAMERRLARHRLGTVCALALVACASPLLHTRQGPDELEVKRVRLVDESGRVGLVLDASSITLERGGAPGERFVCQVLPARA